MSLPEKIRQRENLFSQTIEKLLEDYEEDRQQFHKAC